MTDQELNFLKASIDQIVLLETSEGGRHFAQILFVFDEGETPDVFYLKVERGAGGEYVPEQGKAGYSVLLADVLAVRPLAAVAD